MIFQLTAKNCQVTDKPRKIINRHLAKITQMLPNIEGDLIVLRLTIRKNIDKYHPPRARHEAEKTYADSKPALANFEGSISFRLNKTRFYVHFKGKTIDECVTLGFNRLFVELEKFKDLHFSSESKYPDHRTIRGSKVL